MWPAAACGGPFFQEDEKGGPTRLFLPFEVRSLYRSRPAACASMV